MGILTKEHQTAINQALKAINDIKSEIVKAKSAGIDVSVQETELKQTESQLLAIKRVYFPS